MVYIKGMWDVGFESSSQWLKTNGKTNILTTYDTDILFIRKGDYASKVLPF